MNNIVETAIQTVTKILKEQGCHAPMCFFLRDGEMLQIGPYLAEEGVPMHHVWAALAARGVMIGANQYMVISEAYMTKKPIDTDLSTVTPPSEDPNRINVVLISWFEGDKSKDIMVSIPFNANNKGVEVKEPMIDIDGLGGDMYDIFHNAIDIQRRLEAGETTPRKLLDESRQKLEQKRNQPQGPVQIIREPEHPELN